MTLNHVLVILIGAAVSVVGAFTGHVAECNTTAALILGGVLGHAMQPPAAS